jgi:hypothetical protein
MYHATTIQIMHTYKFTKKQEYMFLLAGNIMPGAEKL